MEVGINPEEQGFWLGKVKKRAVNADGAPIGTANNNVLLDSWAREVEFSDGQTEILTANVIAENLLAEVDPENNGFCSWKTLRIIGRHLMPFPGAEGHLRLPEGSKEGKEPLRDGNSL